MVCFALTACRLAAAAAAGAAAIAAAGFLLHRHMSAPRVAPFSLLARKQAAHVRQAFVLAVNLRFKQLSHKQQFVAIWQPLAEYVRAQEPTTLAFELLESDSNPLHLLVYERYVSREAYADVHRASQPFQDFKAAQAALPFTTDVQGQSFIEQNLGFML